MSKRANRNYSLADSTMLTQAELMHKYYKEQSEVFTTFSPQTFTPDYEQLFLQEINRAHQIERDSVVRDQQAKETAEVHHLLEELGEQYLLVKYYIKRIFPNDRHMQNQMGFNDFAEVRQSPDRMILFLDTLLPKLKKYQEPLLAAGYPEAELTAFQEKAKALRRERIGQVDAKSRRLQKTRERVAQLNRVWDYVSEIAEAAKLLYRNNPTEATRFLLPQTKASKASWERGTEQEVIEESEAA